MIDTTHNLPINRQSELLDISRSNVYYLPRPESDGDLVLMRRIDEFHLNFPFAGSRMLRDLLRLEGHRVGRQHVRTLMDKMGIEAIYRKRNTSAPHPAHPIYLRRSFYVPLAAKLKQAGLQLDRVTANSEVRYWLREVANERIHGTTDMRPRERLQEEVAHLQAIPVAWCGDLTAARPQETEAMPGNSPTVGPTARPTRPLCRTNTEAELGGVSVLDRCFVENCISFKSPLTQGISAASAVNSKGAFWFATYKGGLTGELFVELLKKLMHRRKKAVHMVVDGLPAHKNTLVKHYVASTNGKLTLHFLPGYAPDLNPDELVWSHTKRTGVARNPLRKGEKLEKKVNQQLQALAKNPALVRSFFGHPSVAYISDC